MSNYCQGMDGNKKPVVVTTSDGFVFFGYGELPGKRIIDLDTPKQALYFPAGGVAGLSKSGPPDDSNISPAGTAIRLFNVTTVATCTPEAVEKWEKDWS